MPLTIEHSGHGIQNIRTVADVINNCNLACQYCHPNHGWTGEYLPIAQIENLLQAAEEDGIFEVTLTGGEITMHPEFRAILEATHILNKTSITFVTNATRITPNIVKEISNSNVERICVSVDGPDADSHNSRRGKNFDSVMAGLKDLQGAGKPITVISVVHPKNYSRILELSDLLATQGLASEHHMCAPSYSGTAIKLYDQVSLKEPQFDELQNMIDASHDEFQRRGLYTTFNSYWPATGKRGKVQQPRTMTLIQFTEQVKDIYMIVRPNGDVRLTSAAWGRETVGNAVIGNLKDSEASELLRTVDELYRSGRVLQLPREVEAGHKFHVGSFAADYATTNALITDGEAAKQVEMVPIRKISEIDLLHNALDVAELKLIAQRVLLEPQRWRVSHHASGVDLIFDRKTSHLTVVTPQETEVIAEHYDLLEKEAP